MALSTLKPDGTQGTATVELIYMYKTGREIRKYDGCIVKNDANLESCNQMHIKQSADKTKFKNSKYFVCIYDPDFKEKRNEATVCVSCHRFSKPSRPKKCELNFSLHNFVKVQDHIFIPCDSQNFNDSTFLEKHSKKILEAQDLTQVNTIFGLMYDEEKKSPKFIPLKLVYQLFSNVYGIGAEDYEKLEDAGPILLQDNKTVVGSFKKRGNYKISISVFENNQEITTTSCTDGAPGDGTGQAAATPGDEIGQVAATPGDGTGQAVHILESAPGDEDEAPHPWYTYAERSKRQRFEEEYGNSNQGLGGEFWDEELNKILEEFYRLSLFMQEKSRDFKLLCSKTDGECSFHGSKDLADRLNAPTLIKAKCKSNTAHSPTLELMQSPKVSTLSVNALVKNLKAIPRYDVANLIEKEIPENERNFPLNVALNRYKRLFKGVASRLDEETRNNWKTLGSEFGLQGDELKQTESNPAKRFLEHVYATMESGELTVKRLLQLLKTIETPSIRNLLKDWGITRQDNSRSIKDVIPPDSEIMWRLCLELNKSKAVGGMKKWEHLALSWGIKPEMYSQFDPSQKTSPTEKLLRWLVGERPDFTVNELCYHLGKIGCHDAKVFLEEKLKEWQLQKEVYI